MKVTVFIVVLLLALCGLSQIPVPRGVRQGEQADAQAQQNIPPPAQQTRSVDSTKLKRDADELAALAASIPSAVDQTTHGLVPNDLMEKLKRIEKLSKRLRNEINP